MNPPFSARLWILVAALLMVAGGTILGLSSAWRRVQQLERNLTRSQIESFRLAGTVQREILSLNDSMLRYALARDPEQWAHFDQTSDDLGRWLDGQQHSGLDLRSALTTEDERLVFSELNRAYADYLTSAQAVHSNAQPALVTSRQLALLDNFNAKAERMLNLTRQLADAHRRAEASFLAAANASLAGLRGLLVASVVLLLILVAAMGWVTYRDMIAPLRTKLVRSLDLLERQEKLATLGTLAAGIAHEIRNPLTSLKARLYTLQKHLQEVPAARRDTDIISAEVSRLERIVQDVLHFARPSDPKLNTISADVLLREVHGLMAPNLESHGVHLAMESLPELRIRADSGHLKQVLINLIRNASEAIEGAGTITLRSRASRVPTSMAAAFRAVDHLALTREPRLGGDGAERSSHRSPCAHARAASPLVSGIPKR